MKVTSDAFHSFQTKINEQKGSCRMARIPCAFAFPPFYTTAVREAMGLWDCRLPVDSDISDSLIIVEVEGL